MRRPGGPRSPSEDGGGQDGDGGERSHREDDPRPEPGLPATVRAWLELRSGRPAEDLQGEGEIARGLETPVGLLLQTSVDHPGHRRRSRPGERLGIGVEDRVAALDHGRAGERTSPRDELAQHCPEGEDVAAGVQCLSADLLRRHVARRSDDGSRPGRASRGAHRRIHQLAPARRRLGGQLGDAEVEELDLAVDADERILRLHVAVDDSALMRCGQAVRHLRSPVQRGLERNGALRELAPQRFALKELGDEVRLALVKPDVVDRHQIRMVQRAGDAGLLLEAPHQLGAGDQ